MSESFEQQVYSAINRIPKGRVATYGQIAALAGSPRSARAVGTILRHQAEGLPWQRVINREGRISIVNMEYPAEIQAELLRQEGVEVQEKNGEYFVDLLRYLWET
jgi:methylated-DNA-protein-cysteine methyltransferase-like protein